MKSGRSQIRFLSRPPIFLLTISGLKKKAHPVETEKVGEQIPQGCIE